MTWLVLGGLAGCEEPPVGAVPSDATVQVVDLGADAGAPDRDADAPPDSAPPATDAAPSTPDMSAPDADPWPDSPAASRAVVTVVHDGLRVAGGATLRLTTASAGLAEPSDLALLLTLRAAEALAFDADGWLDAPGWSVVEIPARLEPGETASVRLRVDPSVLDAAGALPARLTVPGADFHLELLAEVPRPLRMVVVGDGGWVLASDDYGASFLELHAPAEVTTARTTLTWGAGRFFRTSAAGLEWGDPGVYDWSADGVEWHRAAAADAFWPSACVHTGTRFTCVADSSFVWSETGGSVVHEAREWRPLLNALAYADGRYVAGGRSLHLASSDDGLTWARSQVEDGARAAFQAVAYGDGVWLAAGGIGPGRDDPGTLTLATSDDGQTWTVTHEPGRGWAVAAEWFDGRFVVATQSHLQSLLESPDGVRWTPIETAEWTTYRLLGSVDGWLYAAVNPHQQPARIERTRDVRAWEVVHTLSAPASLRAMAIEGRVVAQPPEPDAPAPPDGPGDPRGCLRAEPGSVVFPAGPAWGPTQTAEVALRNACEQRLRFLGHPAAWVQGAGFELTRLPPVQLDPDEATTLTVRFRPGRAGEVAGRLAVPYDAPGSPLVGSLAAPVEAPRTLVFVGDGRHVVTSEDYGETATYDAFETLEAHGDALQRGVCWGADRFVAVGGNDDRRWWTSADGSGWAAHVDGGARILADCAFGGGRFVAAGALPAWSRDGLAWIDGAGDAFGRPHLRAITYGAERFVATGDTGRVAVTRDGTRWDADLDLDTGGLRDIVFGGGAFVAGGEAGWLATSTDGGDTWLTQQVGDGPGVDGLAYAGGRFLAGAGGQVFGSDDGLVWAPVNAAPTIPRAGLGQLFFGTDGRTIHRSHDGGFSWEPLHTTAGGLGLGRAVLAGP